MNSDDPFFNSDKSDRTIILKPTPGRQQGTPPSAFGHQQAQAPRANYQPVAESIAFPESSRASINVLSDEAAKLMALISQVKITPHHNDVQSLHRQAIQTIQAFEQNARNRGVNPEQTLAARYALCACIDETVLNTPWGSNSLWSTQSMLSVFHQETSGGEKFYMILERILQQPSQNIDLLELMFICLSLGFEGKYRIIQNGRSQLDMLRDELFRTIRSCRGDIERDLSPHWAGIQSKTTVFRQIPIWVIAAITAALLVTIYAGFNYMLYQKTAPIIEQIETINPETPPRDAGS